MERGRAQPSAPVEGGIERGQPRATYQNLSEANVRQLQSRAAGRSRPGVEHIATIITRVMRRLGRAERRAHQASRFSYHGFPLRTRSDDCDSHAPGKRPRRDLRLGISVLRMRWPGVERGWGVRR